MTAALSCIRAYEQASGSDVAKSRHPLSVKLYFVAFMIGAALETGAMGLPAINASAPIASSNARLGLNVQLTANLAVWIGSSVNIQIPLASAEISRLRCRERRFAFDGAD